ncbi:MAG: carbohydrate kinase family protein, partial [Thermoanaerobaculia bacterium]
FWPEGCIAAARRLRALGRTVTLDTFVAPRPGAAEEHRRLLPLVDIAMPNEEEARLITGLAGAPAQARRLLDWGARVAVVKRGERGALLATREEVHEVPAERVEVVDTCGAGDNFAGGFLAAYLRGLPLLECVRVGCAMGTRCVTARGSLTATADREFLDGLRARLEKGD